MRIWKIQKYIFCLWLLLFFFCSITLWACHNGSNPSACKNSFWWDAAYDNQTPVGWTSLVYLKMFNLENLSCSGTWDKINAANRVKAIQGKMANCGFSCVDWFFWSETSAALASCASTYCSSLWDGYLAPTLDDGENLKCDDFHDLENWQCCKPKPACDHPIENWSCGSGYRPNDDNTCCVIDCWTPQECTNDWEIWSEASCKCVCNPDEKCCWIQLNTVVPFIWDCIEMVASNRSDTTSVTSVTAFPILVQWLMKILMSAIMIFSFLMVIIAWLMMTTWAFSSWNFAKWKTILKNVIISLILLGCSWLILSLVNPNFFGG